MTNRRSPDNELRFVIFHWSLVICHLPNFSPRTCVSAVRRFGCGWCALCFICGFVPKAWELKNERERKDESVEKAFCEKQRAGRGVRTELHRGAASSARRRREDRRNGLEPSSGSESRCGGPGQENRF